MALVKLKSDLSDINSFDQPNRNVEKESPSATAADAKKRGKFLDAKGDFVSPFNYSPTNKAQPIREDLGRKSFENDNFRGERNNPSTFNNNIIDSRGNKRINFDPRRPYTIDRNSELLELHTEDNFLEKLYGRALSNTDELGIRKNTRFSFDQPFVIRKVDNRLGFGGLEQFSKNNTILRFLDTAGGLIDSVAGDILGRAPNEFVGASVNSFTRTAKFLLTPAGIGFLAKQQVLKRRNKQTKPAEARYEEEAILQLAGLGEFSHAAGKISAGENLKKYNSLSLASIPGVTDISINSPDLNFGIKPFINSIKDTIHPIITDFVDTNIVRQIRFRRGSSLSPFGTPLANAVKGVVKGIGKPIGKVLGLAGGGLRSLGGFAAEKLNIGKPNINISITTPSFIDTGGLKQISNTIAGKIASTVDALAFGGSSKVNLDKKNLVTTGGRKAHQHRNTDLVNLIPYGSDRHNAISYEDLDFIPFSFYDVVNQKRIVFRAILSGITDTFSPEYASERYVGRPDSVYVYQGTTREISFTFDVYPKSDRELRVLWEKLNYLAGLCYPTYQSTGAGGGLGMIAPFAKLTIGDMYRDSSGYISSLTYTVQDSGTYEIVTDKLPKYIQASCTFVYIGDRLPSSTQKHYEVKGIVEEKYETEPFNSLLDQVGVPVDPLSLTEPIKKQFT